MIDSSMVAKRGHSAMIESSMVFSVKFSGKLYIRQKGSRRGQRPVHEIGIVNASTIIVPTLPVLRMSLMKAESMEHVFHGTRDKEHVLTTGERDIHQPALAFHVAVWKLGRKQVGPHEDDHLILQPLGRVDGLNLYPWFTYPPFRMVSPSPQAPEPEVSPKSITSVNL